MAGDDSSPAPTYPRPVKFDPAVEHPARVYDYWLGGKDNFAADREAAEAAVKAFPGTIASARANRAFLGRAVRYLAGEAGIRQFLDIGTGLPTTENVHQVAQAAAPECRVVYVDNDPMVLTHARALLTSAPEGATAYIDADLRNPDLIVREAARTLDFTQPVAIMLIAILHFIPGSADPYGIVARLLDAVPTGSYLTISHLTGDMQPEELEEFVRQMNRRATADAQATLRSHAEVSRFLDGLDVVDPGVVEVSKWRPRSGLEAASPAALWGGVARKR